MQVGPEKSKTSFFAISGTSKIHRTAHTKIKMDDFFMIFLFNFEFLLFIFFIEFFFTNWNYQKPANLMIQYFEIKFQLSAKHINHFNPSEAILVKTRILEWFSYDLNLMRSVQESVYSVGFCTL